MRTYRVFVLSSDDHLKAVEIIDAEDDAEAIVLAEAFLAGRPGELWQLDRKVTRVNCDRDSSQ